MKNSTSKLHFLPFVYNINFSNLLFLLVENRDFHGGSGSFQKKKILKTREFTQNFHFKERYTVKLDEYHRLEAIALV
jgi:hypothetical protein